MMRIYWTQLRPEPKKANTKSCSSPLASKHLDGSASRALLPVTHISILGL